MPMAQLTLRIYLPPSVRRIGLPVLVMAMSDRKRFPATLGTMIRAERAEISDDTILAVAE